MERLPIGDFGANAFWFALGVLTYNVFVLQKEYLLAEQYRTKTIGTILIETAGKVVRHRLLLCTTKDKLLLYRKMRERCMVFG